MSFFFENSFHNYFATFGQLFFVEIHILHTFENSIKKKFDTFQWCRIKIDHLVANMPVVINLIPSVFAIVWTWTEKLEKKKKRKADKK